MSLVSLSHASLEATPKMEVVDAHPVAEVFPLMCGTSFDDLVESISKNGLRNPIVLYEGKILDGRNRYLACEKAGIEPRFVTFEGADPIAFVVDENLHRRQLNESQKALAAAKIETLKNGQRLDLAKQNEAISSDIASPKLSRGQISRAMNVGQSTIHRAKVVLEKAASEDIAAINAGKASVNGVYSKIVGVSKRERQSQATGAREQNVKLWTTLRDAIVGLTSLPRPRDLVPIANSYRKRNPVVEQGLSPALAWLKEFADAYQGQ